MIGPPIAHAVCAALVVADVASRGVRLVGYAREAGGSLSLRDSLITTIVGDAAAALTPWRLAGEPARVITMKSGCTVSQSIVALGGESAVNYAVVIACGAWLGSRYGSAWWREVGRGLRPSVPSSVSGWLIAAAIAAIVVASIVIIARTQHHLLARAMHALRVAIASMLRAPGKLLVAGIVLTFVSLAARVAVLPMLAIEAPHHPGVGVLSLVSFSLLYGQLVLPTPSGAGAMDAIVLGGATGIQDGTGELLAAWRVYSTILPTTIGVIVALAHFGPGAWRTLLRRH